MKIENNNDENKKFKVKKCLKCQSPTDPNDEDELFCSKCGAPIINRCSDYSCNKLLKENAKYCKYCGSESLFLNYGLFNNIAPLNDDIFPF